MKKINYRVCDICGKLLDKDIIIIAKKSIMCIVFRSYGILYIFF